jgi:NAD(P)-dependent dehydrogenase (short-subunit alcohol dehydrogenase family)
MRPRPTYDAPLYRGSDKLQDKVALITGGDSGIGRAVAVLYAREGANVAIVYLREEQSDAEETKRPLKRKVVRAYCFRATSLTLLSAADLSPIR